MNRFRGKNLVLGLLASLGSFVVALNAWATLSLQVTGPGGYNFTVIDNGSGDRDSTPGVIDFRSGQGGAPSIANYNIASNLAFSNAPGNFPAGAILDITYTVSTLTTPLFTSNCLNNDCGQIQMIVIDSDFTLPSSGLWSSHIGGTGTGTFSVSAQQCVGSVPNPTDCLATQGPFTNSPYASDLSTYLITLPNPFAIKDALTVTLGNNSSTTGDLQSTIVPEPSTMLLLGSGLIAVAVWARRRVGRRNS
jgi:hypothetical protein